MADEQPKSPTVPLGSTISEFHRDADFVSRYANNFQIEGTAFDAKLVFGLLDQSKASKEPGRVDCDQHTAISLSWPEVKLLIFYLQLHLAGHEKENGKVKISANALPPEPPATPPAAYDNPRGREALELIRKMRADFLAKLNAP